MADIFKKGKFKLFALVETKLKGKKEISWSGVNVIFTGVHEMERAREGIAVLLNDVWHSSVVKFGSLSPRILYKVITFVWWWGTAPLKEMVKEDIGFGMTWTRLWIA